MANWNQKTADYIKDQIHTWSEEFFQSNDAKGLNKDKGATIIATFADKMYESHERTPKTWVGYGAKEVLQENFEDKQEAISYLENFFAFLNNQNYIKNASALTKALHEVDIKAVEKKEKASKKAPKAEKKATPKKEAAAKKETVKPTTASKNPYNQMVKERNLTNKLFGKKKNRKKRRK